MPRSKNGNLMSLAVVSLLDARPMHPYEIGQLMKQWGITNSIKLNVGNLYATINSLLSEGLIAVQGTGREGHLPERTVYELTPAGHEFCRRFLREVVREPVQEYPRFLAGLSFLAHLPPDEVAELLAGRADQLRRDLEVGRRRHEKVLAQGVDRLFLIENTYSRALLEAELNWIEAFLGELSSGALTEVVDGSRTWTALRAGWLGPSSSS